MGISRYGERDDLARSYVEHLEEALAAAMHERDLAAERARLAADGVEQLERRLERDRAEARERLAVSEKHLANAKIGIESRDRRLEVAEERLGAREAKLEEQREELEENKEELEGHRKELERQRAESEARGRELAAANARLQLLEQELAVGKEELAVGKEELAASKEELAASGAELAASQKSGEEARRELALRERDLAARVRELGRAGEELITRERELEAAGTLLEAQGADLARARERAEEAARQREEAEQERVEAEQERAEAERRIGEAERARAEVATRLEARERHLANAKAGIESRDRRLEAAEERLSVRDSGLAAREAELRRLRARERERERRLALAEARLEKARQRTEYFQGSLVELRSGRAYRLMRVLWRLRRPFRRAPRDRAATSAVSSPADEPEPASRPRLRVAAVLDEMSAACFGPECELIPLTLEGWAEQLDERRPDLLLVESAWNANGGEWQYRIASYPRKDLVGLAALRALLDGCRERGIPTAFWNKEDPVHFERFAEAASLFDHVFTTDARCVERYRALPGERTVTPLPFAAQPRLHNPAGAPERSSSPCFAGAWYRDRHPDRRVALEALLDAARPYGLVIYDRAFGGRDEAFGFPARFAPHILGKLPYERILDVYRSHRVFLNANSVVDSPTMCSRRVFELAACDTAILSTPGAALAKLLGEGLVEEVGDERAAAAALERLLGDEPERRRRTRAARRQVFAEHTYADRLATIAAVAGVDMPTADGDAWELVLQPGVRLSADAESDLCAASIFAAADAIGVGARNGEPAPEHRPVAELDPRALLLSPSLIAERGAPAGSPEEIRAELRRWSEDGVRLYAADADLLAT